MADQKDDATLDPGFFEGRLLVEILMWDWPLHVGLSTSLTPRSTESKAG